MIWIKLNRQYSTQQWVFCLFTQFIKLIIQCHQCHQQITGLSLVFLWIWWSGADCGSESWAAFPQTTASHLTPALQQRWNSGAGCVKQSHTALQLLSQERKTEIWTKKNIQIKDGNLLRTPKHWKPNLWNAVVTEFVEAGLVFFYLSLVETCVRWHQVWQLTQGPVQTVTFDPPTALCDRT